MWDAAKARLQEVEEKMKSLMDAFEEAKAKKERLQAERDDCKRKLDRAGSLILKLAGENENWQIALADNKKQREHLVGDVLISSGIIAYLGVFLMDYRQDAIKTWVNMLDQFKIKSTEGFSLQRVLGDQVKIREWQINKLPADDFSVDNAIIMENSTRWPLMIDPQLQANIWIKKSEEANQLKIIKPTMDPKVFSRTLENAIPFGYPVILEDAGEVIDPMLEPLLSKRLEKKGGIYYIQLGDSSPEYSLDFKFYVTTKLSKPHYAPEVCVKVAMLNFMVTEEGLEDQMLSIVVKHEDPKKYEQRNVCIT